jgi:RNA polymerase sigma factor (sigma-70 family)
MPRADDAALVAAAREGDRAAFARLVERHYELLVATCRRVTGDPEVAADAAQEAVVTALLGLDRLRDDERFGAWLIGIGLNIGRRALQERARWSGPDGADREANGPAPEEAAAAATIAERVRAAVAALPAGQRAAVALFHLGGLSHAEVADRLDTRPGAVKTRLHKASRALRRSLADVHREEFPMSAPVPMRIADVRRPAARPEKRIVVLEEVGGQRQLPIWVGIPEAEAIVVELKAIELPRPGAHHLGHALLRASGGRVAEVRISTVVDHVFYATVVLGDGVEVDARPSDALALALIAGAAITADRAVLDSSAQFVGVRRPEFAAEVTGPHDGASVLADEARERVAERARKLADLDA